MGLRTYRKKRNFDATPEPRGGKVRRDAPRPGQSFVIQKHDATRLHYDFRLELEGVLVSWAIPKGPSLDPSERRLAVHVEDHPLEYGTFEGIIPTGHYGGGPVLLWDRGTWTPEGDAAKGLKAGKLKFELDGERLQGRWSLVRMRGRTEDPDEKENWLLIKSDDADASTTRDITAEHVTSVESGRDLVEIAAKPGVGAERSSARRAARVGVERSSTRRAKRDAPPRALKPAVPDGAIRGPLPPRIDSQLATLVTSAPEGPEWIHELKFDGYRIGARLEKGKVRLLSRNHLDWTDRFQAIADELARLPVESAFLDGEVVAADENGQASFNALQKANGGGGKLSYHVFDLLHLDGFDLRGAALRDRKAALEALLARAKGLKRVHYSAHVEGHGREVHEQACARALEGIIAKRADRPHVGRRTKDWLKVKCEKQQELVIGGFTEPQGSRDGLGALLLGVHDDDGLRYAGKVGTGFDDKTLRALRARLGKLEQSAAPFSNPPRGAQARGVHWVKPTLVAQVRFLEWTGEGQLRHPSFEGLREDKSAKDVRRERAVSPPAGGSSPAAGGAAPPNGRVVVAGVALSHPDRVVFDGTGATKLDVARYVEGVSGWMLPHLAGRPLAIVRCPEGGGGPCFFQKTRAAGMPKAISSTTVQTSDGPKQHVVLDTVEGLVGLVQFGVLEIHCWGARADDLDKPDRVVFDLDPDPSVKWPAIVEAARLVRDRLEALDLESFVKTTGGKGLHVVMPMRRGPSYDMVKTFAQSVASAIAAEAPERFTANMAKSKRTGRIFIDYLRNGRGATAVAPYSMRAKPEGTVAVPLAWSELGPRDLRASFTTVSVPERLASLKADPWEAMGTSKQGLSARILKALG